MRVFNLAEELEKERKKNKELEERNEALEKGCKEYRYHIKQMNKIHDNCLDTIEELQDRIGSAINILEKRINKIENQEWKSYTGQTDEEYLQEQNEILDILKGE